MWYCDIRSSWIHTIVAEDNMFFSDWCRYPSSAFWGWHVVGNCGTDINIYLFWIVISQAVKRDILITCSQAKSTRLITRRITPFSTQYSRDFVQLPAYVYCLILRCVLQPLSIPYCPSTWMSATIQFVRDQQYPPSYLAPFQKYCKFSSKSSPQPNIQSRCFASLGIK